MRIRWFKLMSSLAFVSVFLIVLFIAFATISYRSANRETLLAYITFKPAVSETQTHLFEANIHWLNGSPDESYLLYGDQFYIDAKLLKWKSWLNYFGLNSWYEFDRVGGRYINIRDEQTKPRSLYLLSRNAGGTDLFDLRQKYSPLGFLVDAEYGSAAFVTANIQTEQHYELFVSNSGLILKSINPN